MNSEEYWRERENEALKYRITDEKEYEKEIQRIYRLQLDAIQKEIESFYAKYASKEGISLSEAKKRVSKHDVQAFERKAAQYVKEKNFSQKANDELRLYNAMMKINRLEMLKANIGLESIASTEELERFMRSILMNRTEDELKRQAGILGKTIQNNAKTAHAIVNGSFHTGTFSDRIWQYQDLMREDIGRALQQGLIQGKNPRALTKDLRQYWYGKDPRTGGGAVYCMERLMRTELARVQTEAQKQSFEKNGFKHYIFIVNHNGGNCCPDCQRVADGGPYLVSKMMPGTNAPPMHPHCRCSTAAYEDDAVYEAWLDGLANGSGQTWKTFEKEESKPKHKYKNTVADLKMLNSSAYRRKFDGLTEDAKVNRALWNTSKDMIEHRSGTKYEDLAYIDANTGKVMLNKDFDMENHAKPSKSMDEMLRTAEPYTIIGLHNHPSSNVPSMPDLDACVQRKYKFGVVSCHDGTVYAYSINAEKYNKSIADLALERMAKMGYNDRIKAMFKDAGIEMEVL